MGEQVRSVAIACQGGGSHTAFTAGVLSRLFAGDDLDRYRIVGLSGTSGGAVCALLAWSALLDDDRPRAGRLLEEFWADNAATGPAGRLLNSWMLMASTVQSFGLLPAVSPYHLPTTSIGVEQFREMLQRHIDFDRIEADTAGVHPMLLLGAVDVRSGRFRAFNSRQERITADCVLASAAIPTLFRAVHIDDGAYWDGLFSQNPPLHDLLDAEPDEVWVVQVNPRERATEPTTLLDIADRRNELAGNLSLYQELGFIETIDRLLEDGLLTPSGKYKQVVVRIIELPRKSESAGLGPRVEVEPRSRVPRRARRAGQGASRRVPRRSRLRAVVGGQRRRRDHAALRRGRGAGLGGPVPPGRRVAGPGTDARVRHRPALRQHPDRPRPQADRRRPGHLVDPHADERNGHRRPGRGRDRERRGLEPAARARRAEPAPVVTVTPRRDPP